MERDWNTFSKAFIRSLIIHPFNMGDKLRNKLNVLTERRSTLIRH